MTTVGKETDVFPLRLYQWAERSTRVLKMKLLLFPVWRFPCWDRFLTTESQCKPTESSKTGPWPPPVPGQLSHFTATTPPCSIQEFVRLHREPAWEKDLGLNQAFFVSTWGWFYPMPVLQCNLLPGFEIICAGSMQGERGNDKWPEPGKGGTSLYRNAAQANETVPPLSSKCPSTTSYLEISGFMSSSPYWPLQKEPEKKNQNPTRKLSLNIRYMQPQAISGCTYTTNLQGPSARVIISHQTPCL